jgi:hypothetical protein
MTAERFTVDGSNALEEMLAQTCRKAAQSVRRAIPENLLLGVVLGGGYGRGEGGVLRLEGRDYPYNDIEYYVFLASGRRNDCQRYGKELEKAGHQLSQEAGVEVEFKVLTWAQFKHAGPSMFYYDLAHGHKVIYGNLEAELSDSHHGRMPLPRSEASRLMLNRCSGLLFSLERLQRPEFTLEESDFVARNIAKLQLAVGDVFLVHHGLYHSMASTRHERLANRWEISAEWVDAHKLALDFKLHPQRSTETRQELAKRFAAAAKLAQHAWLWSESRRLNRSFASPQDYAFSPCDKCPEQMPLRNLAVNLKVFGLRSLAMEPWKYPRNRLYNALPLLLWPSDNISHFGLDFAQKQLLSHGSTFSNLIKSYVRLWEGFR